MHLFMYLWSDDLGKMFWDIQYGRVCLEENLVDGPK